MRVRKVLQILLRLGLCFGIQWTVTSGDTATNYQRTASITDMVATTLVYDEEITLIESDSEDSVNVTTATSNGTESTGSHGMMGSDAIAKGGSWKWKFSWGWLPILQIVVSFVGLAGNLLVVLAVARRRSSHSTDILVGALAVADLMASVFFIPLPRAIVVPDTVLGAVYCKTVFPYYYRWTCLIASAYTLVGMSFERMVAVTVPLRFTRIFSKRNVLVFIAAVWIGSPLICLFFITLEIKNGRCVPAHSVQKSLTINTLMLAFRLLIPGSLMIGTQIITAISLNRQSKRLRGAVAQKNGSDGNRRTFHVTARNCVVKMLFIVVAVFLLSWGPVQITWLLMIMGYIPMQVYVRDTGNLVTYINTLANPFIYAARYPKFRSAVKDIFMGVKDLKVPLFKDA